MAGRLKILSLIPYKILPAQLGGEKGIAVFNEYLCKQVDLTGITTRNNDPSLAKGYQLINSLSNGKLKYINIFLYLRIRKLLRTVQADYLLIEHPYFGWLAWMIKKTMSIPIAVHSHNMEYMRSKSIGRWWWKALKWYESWVYGFADKVFFISEDDLEHARINLGTDERKSLAVTYGITQQHLPSDLDQNRSAIVDRYQIDPQNKILLFNGALYHSTNYEALEVILNQINPVLLKNKEFRYTILVCGKGLPDFFNDLKEYADKNVIYAGFVDDISVYFKAADIFLNPILSGGGVKTKAIEALAMNCTVVSTPLGALGLKKEVCGDKLKIVDEGNWKEFAHQVMISSSENSTTQQTFFEYYYWENIISRAVRHLQS